MSKEDTAVLLISHGSTRPYGKVVFDEIKEKFIEKTGLKTEVGYILDSLMEIILTTTIFQALMI